MEGIKVLILDDDEDVRMLLECVLKKMGLQAAATASSNEAVIMYQQALALGQPYTAAILDMNIPGEMGGVEVAEKILALDPAAFLYVSSGNDFDPVMQSFREYGFSGKINKPLYYADAVEAFKPILQGKG